MLLWDWSAPPYFLSTYRIVLSLIPVQNIVAIFFALGYHISIKL